MYSPSPGRRAASIESEVFYWRLLGFQVVLIYGFILVALITGLLSIHDENFDRTLLTVVAIFCSNLLYMPQTKQPSFDSCTEKKVKLSNAAYRFSRQWSIRRQDKRRRACSQLHINIIRAGCRALVSTLSLAKQQSAGTWSSFTASPRYRHSLRSWQFIASLGESSIPLSSFVALDC